MCSVASATTPTASASRCGVVWCDVVWCGVVWCGVVWCGVMWCGVVWCGVVWCGWLMGCLGRFHSLTHIPQPLHASISSDFSLDVREGVALFGLHCV